MSEGAGALSPGSRIAGRYEVQGRAGDHPAFVRWRAREGADEVELWSVRRDLFAAPDAAVTFVDEVLASRRLTDSHIRRPRDAALVDSALIVVMTPEGLVPEMLSSRDPASDSDLLRLARALASGLGAAHGVGLTHGRLIPADLVEDGALIKVGGVGMWSRADSQVAIAHWQPYRRFLAPEVAAGNPPTDRADVLASAAILAAAAVGAAAESARDVRDLHDAVAARRPDVAIALAEAFDTTPESRPPSVALLVDRLDECFSGGAGRPTSAASPVAGAAPVVPGPPPIPTDASSRRIPALPMPVGARRKLAGVGARSAGFENESETVRVPVFEPPPAARRDGAGDPSSGRTPAATASSQTASDAPQTSAQIGRRAERVPSFDDSQADIETSAFIRARPGAQEPSAGERARSGVQEPSAGEVDVPGTALTPPGATAVPAQEPSRAADSPPAESARPHESAPPAGEAASAAAEPTYVTPRPTSDDGTETGSLPAVRQQSRPLFPVPSNPEADRKPIDRRLLWAAAAVGIVGVAGVVLWVALAGGDRADGPVAGSEAPPASGRAGEGDQGDESPAANAQGREGAASEGPGAAGGTAGRAGKNDAEASVQGGSAADEPGTTSPAPAPPPRPAAAAGQPAAHAPGRPTVEPLGPCPAGMIELSKSVCIDQYEAPGGGRKPASGITLAAARAACAARGARLCTGSEWERACRGKGGASYPYGPAFRPAPCNVSGALAAAGAFPDCVSRVGAYDMAGNVAEWASNGRLRGGSALDRHRGRCSKTDSRDPNKAHDDAGYRCCADTE